MQGRLEVDRTDRGLFRVRPSLRVVNVFVVVVVVVVVAEWVTKMYRSAVNNRQSFVWLEEWFCPGHALEKPCARMMNLC